MTARIEIEIYSNGVWATDEQKKECMDGIRFLCSDLLADDQTKSSLYHGEDGMKHTSIFVRPGEVHEAVSRINSVGFATDEDEEEIEELEAGIDYPVDGMVEA